MVEKMIVYVTNGNRAQINFLLVLLTICDHKVSTLFALNDFVI